MRALALGMLVLAGCGATRAAGDVDAGPTCIAAGEDAFCDAAHPCCAGAICDPSNRVCRPAGDCGQDGEGCSAALPCCGALRCVDARCTVPPGAQDPQGAGTGSAGGGPGTGSGGGPGPGATSSGPAPGSTPSGGSGDPGPRRRGGWGAPHPL